MGLVEKRIAAAYQADKFPGWKQKLNALCGYELGFSVGWEELIKEGFAEAYPATLDYNFFIPLEKSLADVCQDELGKSGLREKVKNIKITSTRPWSSLEVTIEGDTLHLDADPSYQRDDSAIADYTSRITKELERVL